MELEIGKLLKSAWIAAILPILIASIPFPSSSSFHRLVSSFAKRGKTSLHTSNKFTVPQRFFLHFYLVAVVWTTFLLLTTWLYAYNMVPLGHESLHYTTIASHLTGGSHIFSRHKSHSTPYERRYIVWRTVLLLLLMEVQVLRRLYETVYIFNYSPSARMHIFGYFTGLLVAHAYVQFSARMILMTAVGCCFSEASFYTAAPLSLCSMCVPEVVNFAKHCVADFIVKGRDKISILEFDWLGYVNPLTKLGWCQWIGVAVFFWGWIHQQRCHTILGLLRENKEETDEYTIPHGDWFEFVSCPHYLAEIVIYGGLLIASGGSDHTICLLFGFVVVNLVFAAAETQRWYIRKFENYPQTRRAILPFVY